MADLPADTDTSPKTLKEQYVPFEKRESQNIDPTPFVIETIKFFVVAKLSALAGFFAGNHLAKSNIRIGRIPIDGQWGGLIGGFTGGIYELFHHWKKVEGTRLGVKNISSDLKTAIDPAQLEKESKMEEAFIADLQKLENTLGRSKSHSDAIINHRKTNAQDTGLNT